jgi:organic hydroperoxide reductase OsmC/OhrA
LHIQKKEVGGGSAVNGGELFLLALATCYCNDLYREAARVGLDLATVEVAAEADFLGVGLAATNIRYKVRVHSTASGAAIADLIRHTDTVAEIHNTVRTGASVTLIHD